MDMTHYLSTDRHHLSAMVNGAAIKMDVQICVQICVSIILGIYTEVRLLDQMVNLFLIF